MSFDSHAGHGGNVHAPCIALRKFGVFKLIKLSLGLVICDFDLPNLFLGQSIFK